MDIETLLALLQGGGGQQQEEEDPYAPPPYNFGEDVMNRIQKYGESGGDYQSFMRTINPALKSYGRQQIELPPGPKSGVVQLPGVSQSAGVSQSSGVTQRAGVPDLSMLSNFTQVSSKPKAQEESGQVAQALGVEPSNKLTPNMTDEEIIQRLRTMMGMGGF